MICPECGTNIPDGAIFCTGCGAQMVSATPMVDPAGQASQMPGVPDANQPAMPTAVPSQPVQQPVQQAGASASGWQPAQQQAVPQPIGVAGVYPAGQPAQPAPSGPVGVPASQAGYAGQAGFPPPAQPGMPGSAAPYVSAGAPNQPGVSAQVVEPIASAAATKKSGALKYGLIAGAVVLAIIVGSYFVPTGAVMDDDDVDVYTDEPQVETDGSGGTSQGTAASGELGGLLYTIPDGWEMSELDNGYTYDNYADGGWSSIMLWTYDYDFEYSEADLEDDLQSQVDYYNGDSDIEVVDATTMSIDGCPATYLESIWTSTDIPVRMIEIEVISPSGELITIEGSCTDSYEEGKRQIAEFVDSLAFE